MPDEQGYYSMAEKDAYQPGVCETCGSAKRVKWYPHTDPSDMTNRGDRWSASPEMCPEGH